MKRIISILTAILILVFAFSIQLASAQNKFLIEGNIHAIKNGTVIKLFDIDQQTILDSAHSVEGKFMLKGHVDMPTTCWLECMDEYAIVQVENLAMKFDSPLKNMKTSYTALGGREQELQNTLNTLQRPFDRVYLSAYDSINNKLYSNDIQRKALIKVFNDAQNASMRIYVKFGKENINSYLGLDIIYRNRKTIPNDTVNYLYNTLASVYKNSAKGKALDIFLHQTLAEKGKMMIDFSAKTIAGTTFKLSQLKGRYIYLTFGSAGCAPCRLENKEISKNYERLSKEMAIVYFSLDKNIASWKTVNKEDKITWNSVSDLEGDDGRIKTLYGVQAMPTSFLIDKNGMIIKKIEGYDPSTLHDLENIIQGAKN